MISDCIFDMSPYHKLHGIVSSTEHIARRRRTTSVALSAVAPDPHRIEWMSALQKPAAMEPSSTEPRSPPPKARKPAQVRSKARVEKLLDATVELLATKEVTEIGLYDIAAVAGVPAASVYHFFPNKESAFLAVAERYEVMLLKYLEERTEVGKAGSWSELITQRFSVAVDFYNSNPVFAKLFLSGSMTAEVRGADIENVKDISGTFYEWLNTYFKMPYLPDHQMKFTILISIYDGIWMTSYSQHRCITGPFAREALVAGLAYCRTFLPEVIERRPPERVEAPAPPSRRGGARTGSGSASAT